MDIIFSENDSRSTLGCLAASKGALADLNLKSTALWDMYVKQGQTVPTHAIFTLQNIPQECNEGEIKPFDLDGFMTPLINCVTDWEVIKNPQEGHDYVVHVRSQKGGLPVANTSGFSDIGHSGSVSKTPIMNRLYELLQKKTDDPVFYNGKFPKPDTDFFFAPNNNDEKEKTSVATLAFDSSLKNKIVKKGQTIPVKITKSIDLATVVFYTFTTQSDSITFGYSKSQNPVFNYTIRPDFDEKIKLVAIAKQGNDYISDTTFLIVQADETLNFLPTFKPNPITSNNAIEAKNGHFYNKNNEKIRFWGINIGETAAFPSKAQADKTAKELREKGFNLVRFHAIDNLQGNDSTTLFFGTQETTRKINLAQLDKLHYFVAALKKEGIYSNVNLKTARVFFEKDGIVGADSLFKYGKLGMNYGKGICLFDVQMQDFQKEFAQQVLAPVNPYTGVSLAADPAVAMIELNNEDNIYNYFKTNNLKSFAEGGSLLWRQKKALDALWYEFLKNKYPTNQALAAAWSNGANAFSPVELIENGCFEEKTLGNTWVLEVNAGTATAVLDSISSFAGKKSLRLNVPTAPTQNWHIQMKNYGFSLKKDSVYTIFFAAKADQSKTIRAEVSNNIAPYNSYQGFDVALTSQWKTYQFTFKATENNISNARFAFLTNMQAGTFWFDNVGFLQKNVPAPLPNPELVSNGNFEMSSTNWSLEKNDAAINANFSTTTTAPFEKTTSGQLAVTQASNQYWHIQLKNTGFSLQKDSIYEVVFAAKANTNATLQANASLNIAPFTWFGGQTFNVGTQWQTFSFRFKAKENVSMQGKFAFSMIQNATFWFDAVSVRKISVKGLATGENLWCDNIKRHDFSERYQISENRLGDLTDFYMQLQKNHFDKLYAFLKNNLGVKAMITGTNELLGVQNLRHQTNMDFIDDHSYWDLPNFPVKGFDPLNWSIKNQSMLKSENMEGITNLFSGLKLSTKPYTVSEYNHCAPNIYRTEMMPILTAYGSLHDCDAMILYSYSNNYYNEKGAVKNWFFLQNDRSILNQSPVAAMVYRNQLLKADNQPLTIQYSSDFFRKSAKIYETDNFDYPKYYNPRIALQRNVTVKGVSEATTTNFSTIPNLTTDKITTITNETTLDKTQGILQTVSSKYISIAGFLNNAPNTKVGDLELVNANDFGVITWAALADSSLKNSEKSLLTIVTRQENTGMGWNATKTSLGNNWGNTPLVFPPMKTTLNLSINADTLYVYPLDDKGNAQKGVKYLPSAAKIFTINIDQSQNYTTWYGLKALKKAISPVFPLGLKSCLEDDFLALKKIYDTNNGVVWKDKINWLTNPDMTKWKGVTLTADGCDVQVINIRNNNLSGELPAIDLPKLTQFVADSNKLSGKMPLINAPNLETIYLYDNQLTGAIPNLNLPKLRYLWLSRNPLSGKIPDFDAMPNLEDLRLRNCNLEGSVPNFSKTKLNNSSSLLWLSGNKFVFGDFENKSWLSLNELRYSNQQKIPLTKNGNTLSVTTGSQNAVQKFEWYKNGQLLTTNQSNTFIVTSNGKYHCKITHNTLTIANNVEKNLILETEAVDVNTVATREEILTGIKIYPNPTNDLLFVEIDNQLLTKITLLDINGRLLLQKNISQQGSLDLKQFSKGVYVLKLEVEGKVLFRKVLVE